MIGLLGAAAFAAALDVAAIRTPYARVRDERGSEVPYVIQRDPDDGSAVVAGRSGEALRPPSAPATQVVTIVLRSSHLDVSSARFLTATPSFARDVTIERSDDGLTWSTAATSRISRFRGGRADLSVALGRQRAAWWRATIDDRDDAPLAGAHVELLVRPSDVVFPVSRTHRYTLTFGDPDASAPSYDLAERLQNERWRAERGRARAVVALGRDRAAGVAAVAPGANAPPRRALPDWLTSAAFTGAILVLAAFALRLARAPVAPGSD